eukprot:g4851.t1
MQTTNTPEQPDAMVTLVQKKKDLERELAQMRKLYWKGKKRVRELERQLNEASCDEIKERWRKCQEELHELIRRSGGKEPTCVNEKPTICHRFEWDEHAQEFKLVSFVQTASTPVSSFSASSFSFVLCVDPASEQCAAAAVAAAVAASSPLDKSNDKETVSISTN